MIFVNIDKRAVQQAGRQGQPVGGVHGAAERLSCFFVSVAQEENIDFSR